MAGVEFDLGSYLHAEGDAWSLDGWDLAGAVPSARASDNGDPFPVAAGHRANAAGDATAGLPSLLDDRMLDEILGGQLTVPPAHQQNTTSTTSASECTTRGAPLGSHSTEGKSGATAMNALQQQLDMLQQQQQQLRIPEAKMNVEAMPAGLNQTPACIIKREGGGSQAEGAGRKRRAEDPHVLEMAQKLLEARKTEQEAVLAAESAALTADNHRLISYLKQLGEKLNKARTENGLLKRLVAESGAQDPALRAEHTATLAAGAAAVEPARKRLMVGIAHSVADKVSALSVQHQVDGRDGAPLPCLRSSSLPAAAAAAAAAAAKAAASPKSKQAPAPEEAAQPANPINALADLLRLVQGMQKQARPVA
eukprot:jgi/Tetstr1/430618/TSEL_001990.t1